MLNTRGFALLVFLYLLRFHSFYIAARNFGLSTLATLAITVRSAAHPFGRPRGLQNRPTSTWILIQAQGVAQLLLPSLASFSSPSFTLFIERLPDRMHHSMSVWRCASSLPPCSSSSREPTWPCDTTCGVQHVRYLHLLCRSLQLVGCCTETC